MLKNPSFTVNQKQSFLSAETELMHENLYSNKITFTVKKSAALPAAALPFTAADRNRNRTAKNFFEFLLAIGQSGSAALPLSCVPPFLFFTMPLFCSLPLAGNINVLYCMISLKKGTVKFSPRTLCVLSTPLYRKIIRICSFYRICTTFFGLHYMVLCVCKNKG